MLQYPAHIRNPLQTLELNYTREPLRLAISSISLAKSINTFSFLAIFVLKATQDEQVWISKKYTHTHDIVQIEDESQFTKRTLELENGINLVERVESSRIARKSNERQR